jgi:hypothetical protein
MPDDVLKKLRIAGLPLNAEPPVSATCAISQEAEAFPNSDAASISWIARLRGSSSEAIFE